MPQRRPQKQQRRKRYRRRRRKNVKPTLYKPSPWLFPNILVKKLRYVDTFQLNPGVGSLSSYNIAANDLYDPNITGVGHQPKGFDQIMLAYNHYTVIGSKLTAVFQIAASSAAVPSNVGVHLSDTTGVIGAFDYSELLESRMVNPYGVKMVGGPTITKAVVTKTFSMKKYFGRQSIDDADFRGTSTTSPADRAVYQVWAHSIGTSGDGGVIDVHVILDFIAKFTEPLPLSQS